MVSASSTVPDIFRVPFRMTEQGGATHYITDPQLRAPLTGHRPMALCGRVFLPAPLMTPETNPCTLCVETLAGMQSRHPKKRRGSRRDK